MSKLVENQVKKRFFSQVYRYFNNSAAAFASLDLHEKPPHFKIDVNRLKPWGVMVEKPLLK